jgi:DNA (cytosine-5)-methyltransferase 1
VMADQPLVLSLFPGIDALGYAFELEGFCVVRGPDVITGGDVRRFHIPSGPWLGIIGGPPCQPFSRLVNIVRANGYEPRHGNLIPEFERLVGEGSPEFFVMENVPGAPLPVVTGYAIHSHLVNNRDVPAEPDGCIGPEQNRQRRISFGTPVERPGDPRLHMEAALLANPVWERAVVDSSKEGGLARSQSELRAGKMRSRLPGSYPKRTIAEALRLQGLPEDYLDECPLTVAGKRHAIGNAVPVPTGRAIARAVRRALGLPIVSEQRALGEGA